MFFGLIKSKEEKLLENFGWELCYDENGKLTNNLFRNKSFLDFRLRIYDDNAGWRILNDDGYSLPNHDSVRDLNSDLKITEQDLKNIKFYLTTVDY